MADRTRWGLVAFGGGLAVLGGWLFYSEWAKRQLIEEFMSEVHELRAFYMTAIADGELDENELRLIGDLEQAIETKEKQLEREGLIPEILDRLAKIGIIVTAGFIAAKVVVWLLKHYKPPGSGLHTFTCPSCGAVFSTEEALNGHVRDVHGVNPAGAAEAYEAFQQTPAWVQSLVAATADVGEWLRQPGWQGVPNWALLAIALACILLIALSWGLLSPQLAPVAAAILVL